MPARTTTAAIDREPGTCSWRISFSVERREPENQYGVPGGIFSAAILGPGSRGCQYVATAFDMQVSACLSSGKSSVACVMAERPDTDILFKALADPSRRKLLDQLH